MNFARSFCSKIFPHPSKSSSSCRRRIHFNSCCLLPLPFSSSSPHLNLSSRPNLRNASSSTSSAATSWPPSADASPLSGLEEVMMGYLFGKTKSTQVVHSLWKHVIRKGDVVIDATCGNGHDTLALLRMVADKTGGGRVYAMDIQKDALESTSVLLDQSLSPDEKEHVELFLMCHSKMEEVVPNGVDVRLVAFNLGYLPGGQKTIVTRSDTTLLALEAAKRILAPGGFITAVVYVGHPGGREEFGRVQDFASKLPVENWVCCKLEMLNRPLAPIVVVLHRR
ncbi:hypothetical protein M9H77_14917 [Catharanthus roseus]|uniref:Uncharacterized protein n=1 Tax=Catharanthus roseus TaxID=4058 RepID=A0ACC0BPK5_CATRO|nr:hypothetical protein M9H77_14917 [Catharanthus roseus]